MPAAAAAGQGELVPLQAAAQPSLFAVRQRKVQLLPPLDHATVQMQCVLHGLSDNLLHVLFAVAVLSCMQTKSSKFRKPAQRATAWEIGDNLVCGYLGKRIQAYQQDWDPYISLDNPRIHEVSPFHIDLSEDRVPLPPRSFDLHQAIEHRFAGLKHHLIAEVYRMGWGVVKAGGAKVLRKIVTDYCEQQITPQVVKDDCERLKNLYKVLACPTDRTVAITEPGKTHVTHVKGTNGGYPADRFK